ncbi:O-acyltransferase [Parastagonospora nodorum]|nr:O-acyltransferase [Parastagonospora nodorum]KAH3969468.1 O-acyltransferase [Parastagonospora nodorum]KAH4059535.1 O-acyltransferase [Parastagonospora nodorum]KAH4074991.1 O-acyltransferase [Parastagonospora nodorum]KAH4097050.1 O-acyltransferase [Parastagonospora nodorum]
MATQPNLDRGKPDLTSLTSGQSTMSPAFQGLSSRPSLDSRDTWTPDQVSEASDIDDRSRLKPMSRDSATDVRSNSTTAIPSDESSTGELDDENGISDENGKRRKSIQVVVEDTGKKSKYTVTTDDPDFREVLRSGMRREAERRSEGKSKSKPRELVFTRQFTTFDRQNPMSQSPFHGFFTLFWISMALLLARIAAGNYRTTGSVFGNAEILHLMVDRDLFVMLTTDASMCAATSFGFFLHKAIANDFLTWNGSGWIIQSLWQTFYTVTVIWVTFWRDWPWTHTVFIVLHVFVLLMKQHAYTFYNGYLSRVYRRRNLLQQKLNQLEDVGVQHDSSSKPPGAGTSISTGLENPGSRELTNRRNLGPKYSTNLSTEVSDIASVGKAIEAGQSLDEEQVKTFREILNTEITILDEELRGKCTSTDNMYPNNLTLYNFVEWTCLPTLVYDLEYPRQERVNWWYVAEKSAATLGVIWVMIIISQAYIYPVVVEAVRLRDAGMTLEERWKEFPWVVSDMLFPLLLEQLLSWYVIWECLLNVLAEVTRFADRGFYGDWWNSVSFDQYARNWNRVVHNFLLRHVYHSSISFFHLSKMQATFFTFLLSAIVHEVLMFCLFKKVRGYLFTFQLTQLPLAAFMKTKMMRGQDTLGNIIFWFGLFIGPSLITSLYILQ